MNEDEAERYEGLCFGCSLVYDGNELENDCDDMGGDWDE